MTTKTPTKKAPAGKPPAKKTAAAKRTSVPAPTSPASSTTALDALTATPTGAQVQEVPLDLIDPHPQNPRTDLGDLTELTDSIRAHGIRQNLVLVPHPDTPGRYRAVIGHRRSAAAALAGLSVVPAIVDDGGLDERAQLELMLLENIQRSDLTPVEEAQGYQGLLDLGATVADVARKVGRSRATVESRLTLVTLSESARTAVHTHQATLVQAERLREALEHPLIAKNKKKVAELEQAFGKPQFDHVVQSALSRAKAEAEHAEVVAELEAAGVPIVKHSPQSYSSVPPGVKALSELSATPAVSGKRTPAAITPEEHASCPGHVAFFDRWNEHSAPQFGCTAAKKHGHFDRHTMPKPPLSEKEKAKALAEKRRAKENGQAVTDAEVVRRRFLHGLLSSSKTPATCETYIAHVLHTSPHGNYSSNYEEGTLTYNLVYGDKDPTLVDEAADIERPALALRHLLALAVARVEVLMDKKYWQFTAAFYESARLIARHLRQLESWGYELAPVETEFVTAVEAAVAKRGA